MILCSSPGSFAKDEFIRPLITQCVSLKVFIALVCTNQWNDSDEKRTKTMQEFHDLLQVSYYVEYLIKSYKMNFFFIGI
jgi:hypothetical protein